MRRPKLTGLFFCLFALWLQVLAPVAAATLAGTDPLAGAVICAHEGGDDGGAPQAPASAHEHCLLCQAWIAGGLIPERPAFTALDYPVASPLRWHRVSLAAKRTRAQEPGQPRGPPALV